MIATSIAAATPPAVPTSIATSITAVTVHRNGALVVRRGTIPPVSAERSAAAQHAGDAGHALVEVRGLPLLFAAETLRIRPARGVVSDLEETVRLESKPAPLPPSEEERERLLLQIARIDDELRSVDLLLEVLEQSRPEITEGSELEPKLVDARGWIELLAASRTKGAALAKKRRALATERRDLEHEARRLDERMRALVAPEAPRVLRGVRFTAEPGPFSLEYFVPAARWVPTYALQLTSGSNGSHARLVTAALVAQASGEDWSGVSLSVSTADLTRETTLPTLSSWRIGRAQPPKALGFRPLPSDLPTLFAGYDRGPRRPAISSTTPATPTTTAMPTGGVGGLGVVAKPRPQKSPKRAEPMRPHDAEEDDDGMAFGAALDDLAGGDAYDSGEAGAFELEHSSDARMSLPQSLAFEQAATDPESPSLERRRMAKKDAGPWPDAPSAAPAPSMAMPVMPSGAPMRSESMAAPKSGAAFNNALGAMRGGGGRADDSVVRAQSDLPPRWRTASMRMGGPDESQRGSLLPLDAIERLSWLLETSDVDGTGRAELRRAIVALQQAQQRMDHAPLPRGTSLLLGTSFQSIMRATAATDVPGDGTFYRVEVRVDEAPAQIEHRAVPRASNDVWRMCRLEVKGAPLPPGPLAVYEDGAFKVNARLDMPHTAPPGSTGASPSGAHPANASAAHAASRTSAAGILDVNLGIDPDVRVLSRTVHVRQAEKGLMSQTSRVEHDVDIELRSTRKDPARVVVHDRLPVPAENVKDVVVAVLEEKPPLARTNRDPAGHETPGAFEWRITVMPGDTQKLQLKYAIDLPAKAELDGGNRRE